MLRRLLSTSNYATTHQLNSATVASRCCIRSFTSAAVSSTSSSTTASSSALTTTTASRRPFLFHSAPLEDISEAAFRRLMLSCGADAAYSEMARVENLARKAHARSGSSWLKVDHSHTNSGPCIVQLLSSNEESLRQFLESFVPTPETFAGFQLNLGCPSPEILSLGLGAQAIKRIAKTQRYVEMINTWLAQRCHGRSEFLHHPILSIKLRLGANEFEKRTGSHINLIRALSGKSKLKREYEKKGSEEMKKEGTITADVTSATSSSTSSTSSASLTPSSAAASSSSPSSSLTTLPSSGPISHFILHGRHGKVHYETPCDFDAIAHAIRVSEVYNIIANGDIHTIEQVLRCIDIGAAGVMIGRAAVKEPMIFSRLKRELLQARPDTLLQSPPSSNERTVQQLRDEYMQYAREYGTFDKYVANVHGRIGQKFEANPRVQLNERARVELQGRKHPQYEQVREEDRRRKQYTTLKPYQKIDIDMRIPMEEQLQESVQG